MKLNDLEFQSHALEIEHFNVTIVTIGFIVPEYKLRYPWTISQQNSVGKLKIQEGFQQPPLGGNVDRNIAW